MNCQCKYCRDFFARYRCNAPLECDCPRCQGFCECDDFRDELAERIQSQIERRAQE